MPSADRKISPGVISTALGQAGAGYLPLYPAARLPPSPPDRARRAGPRFSPNRQRALPGKAISSPRTPAPGNISAGCRASACSTPMASPTHGAGLRPGYPALAGTGLQRHPQSLSRVHQGHGDRHPGDPGGPGRFTGRPWVPTFGRWNSITPAPTPPRRLLRMWPKASIARKRCGADTLISS